MRLIDADELIKDIMSYKTMPEIRKAICEVIDDAPTVAESCKKLQEVANERPHGKWIRTEHDKKGEHPETARWYKCSVCNVYNRVNLIFKYCPECGADMRGEAHD